VVSRPRASFDAGLLLPRSVSQVSLRTPCGARFESRAFTFFRTLRCNRRSPDDCASSLRSQNFEDGHVPCSLFSAHVVLAFSVPAFTKPPCDVSALASAFGSFRRPFLRFRAKRPSVFTVRVHDQELLVVLTSFVSTVLAFRRSRATRHRLTVHGLREFVSRFDECRRRPSSVRRSRLLLAPGNLAHPGLSTMTSPCRTALRGSCSSFDVHASRGHRTMTRFEPARLATSMLETSHRCACIHLSFWTDFCSQPKLPRSIPTLRWLSTASSPALRSTCISRRSRPVGTSVLTFAQTCS